MTANTKIPSQAADGGSVADMTSSSGRGRWSIVDTALWCYLCLPVLIFFPGFFIPAIGIPVAALALVAFLHWLPREGLRIMAAGDAPRPAMLDFALLALLAGVWAALGGAGHLFHANDIDWVPRFAVLRDLVVETWPPRYGDGAGNSMILRAPLGYYLPTAWLAHLTDLGHADAMLLVWTWLGVALFFGANMAGTRGQKLAASLLFVFASGLDVIGVLVRGEGTPALGEHMEWWAGNLQYSSNSTLLFWVPNHALPGWIAAAWLWRFRQDSRFLARLPILFLPVMLWSPLTALGLLPLAVAATATRWRAGTCHGPQCRQWLTSLGLVALPGGLAAAYLLAGTGFGDIGIAVPTAPAATAVPALPGQASSPLADTLFFFLVEVGVFAIFALLIERSSLLWVSVATLAVLPWLKYGPNNDIVMRASIPALTILWLVIGAELASDTTRQRLSKALRALLVSLFALAAVTPYQEIYRALTFRVWQADTAIRAPAALGGFSSHYFVGEKGSWLSSWLRR